MSLIVNVESSPLLRSLFDQASSQGELDGMRSFCSKLVNRLGLDANSEYQKLIDGYSRAQVEVFLDTLMSTRDISAAANAADHLPKE
ncbi:hypothetical protein [Rhizobium sp. BK176]|uniref:hypothetical protein n=1 Tax=Rhizobium sp. BK176 TaxID=2587071 RepID=UPI00216857C0|nr:hypothetical protein [Rhizobium sp. BK176]MCS4089952.1 hypothetical protein [Rhizobium sp. BK176]